MGCYDGTFFHYANSIKQRTISTFEMRANNLSNMLFVEVTETENFAVDIAKFSRCINEKTTSKIT
ncbi:Uncharacterised protein [Vibrio cholerae]|nr:Uncharacterised protein [Vibrio cholerae]